ncbi:MAG TPA: adenosylmethionine--8-amino-7-oxononanoate transaminase [Alphaproteobacteria bacterium]|nr:adenosylmethionine--8-amino-7-oxononanoate transaminase [Alphaproteobacteria bacterium]
MIDNPAKHLWLPYNQMKTASPPVVAAATQGCRVRLEDGRELIDGTASWWTACHGYNHPHIAEAVKKQLATMPHFMFGGAVHGPAVKLAERLAVLAPGDLNRVFFSDSGSVAVEVALKMAVQYWLNKGQQGRNKFVSFRHGYHGDTMATMALADPIEGMHAHFKGWLPEEYLADLPHQEHEIAALDDLLRHERAHIAGVIMEPLVQGAGGMKFHDAATLKRISDLCAKHGVLLIADEIFTGFGRTGKMFACEEARITPDILCLGKALTGGTMTLAATLARDHVFEAFWSDNPKHALMHGPTYMANALACAAANASLDLFEREPRLEQAQKIETQLRNELETCRNLSSVVDVRAKGAIGVVQMDRAVDPALKQVFAERGVWIRPLNDIIYLTPSFTISAEELSTLTGAIYDVVKNGLRKAA